MTERKKERKKDGRGERETKERWEREILREGERGVQMSAMLESKTVPSRDLAVTSVHKVCHFVNL